MDVPREVGQQLFRIGELLGSGATGAVYAGVDPRGGQVAVKFLHEHLTEDATMVARFRREARLAARIDSPFVAPVLASGRTQGLYWIAYKRLAGETLEARFHRERRLPAEPRRRIVRQILQGLTAAHSAGVVHRDIKPANVFLERLGPDERARILDFGVSKSREGSSTTSQHPLTSDTETLGSVGYMAPEQIGGSAHADGRADVYAVGVIAFRALAGRLPFAGPSRTVVLHAKLNTDAPTLTATTGIAWPARVEAFLARALCRDAAGRYGSSDEAREAWEQAVEEEGLPSPEDVVPASIDPGAEDRTEVETAPESRTGA